MVCDGFLHLSFGQGTAGPILRFTIESWYLKVLVLIILGLEGLGGTIPNAFNNEMMVDLLVQDTVGQVLNHDIKVARVLVTASINGHFVIYKQGINNAMRKWQTLALGPLTTGLVF